MNAIHRQNIINTEDSKYNGGGGGGGGEAEGEELPLLLIRHPSGPSSADAVADGVHEEAVQPQVAATRTRLLDDDDDQQQQQQRRGRHIRGPRRCDDDDAAAAAATHPVAHVCR